MAPEAPLDELFADVYRRMARAADEPSVVAMYYPYAELKSTIKIDRDRYYVRVSDGLRAAPLAVKQGLAAVLFSKLHRRLEATPYLRRCIEYYQAWLNTPEARTLNTRMRKLRGHKRLEGHRGREHDLGERFDALNRRHFAGDLRRPLLSWTKHRTRHTFGHHDEALNAIVISRSLDDARVPQYVLDFVLYHEMLHVKFGSRYAADGRRLVHTAAFHKWEGQFPRRQAAEDWLEKLAARRAGNGTRRAALRRRVLGQASKRVKRSRLVVRVAQSRRHFPTRVA